MPSEKKVVLITGASRGIGLSLVKGFRAIGYGVVANSRSISKSDVAGDPAILAVDGDIAELDTAVGGLNAVTRSLAIEYASRGIRVNAVSAGAIRTPMHAPETHGFLAGLQPMGRMGEAREILDAVLYLESAAFVTGEILHVDGGWSAGRG